MSEPVDGSDERLFYFADGVNSSASLERTFLSRTNSLKNIRPDLSRTSSSTSQRLESEGSLSNKSSTTLPPIKDRPLGEILASPYSDEESLASKNDEPVITYRQETAAGRSSSRYFDKMAARPWIPSMHSSISGSDVHIPHVQHSSTSLVIHTNLGSSVSNPTTPPPNTPLAPVAPGTALPGPSVTQLHNRVFSETQSMIIGPIHSPRNRIATLKGRTQSFPSSSSDGDSRQKLLPRPGTRQSGSSIASDPEAVLDHGQEFFFDIASPPLAFYRHVPRIFGWEPPQISGHTCTLVGYKLYIFGGKTPTGYNDRLYVFNCTTSVLSSPDLTGCHPPLLRDMAATYGGNWHIYFFGGQDDQKCTSCLYSLDIRNYKLCKISAQGRQPEARRGHSSVLRSLATDTLSKLPTIAIYIFGGIAESGIALNDVWKLHISAVDPLEAMYSEVISLEKDTQRWPEPRAYHTAHSYNTNMLIFGGNDTSQKVFDQVWLFDYAFEKWAVLDPVVCRPRTMHISDVVDNYLIIVGGHDGERCAVTVDVLDLRNGIWHSRICNGVQTTGQCFHKGVYYDSRMFIVGGLDPTHILAGLRVIEMPNVKL
jgi:hypothetical protein